MTNMINMLDVCLLIKLSSIWCLIITVDHLLRMYLNPVNYVAIIVNYFIFYFLSFLKPLSKVPNKNIITNK